MEETPLENAILDEAEHAIRVIAREEAAEIKKLSDAFAGEMEDFRERNEAQTDARIRQESSRMENRAGLDLKKSKLKHIEAFIKRTVEDVAERIGENAHYKRFLLEAVNHAIGRTSTDLEIRLKSEDLVHEQEIREAVKVSGKTRDVTVVEDKGIRWGGCIIVDVHGGRIFDSTIERIYFRKSPEIRREVMTLLGRVHGDAP
ncbi:MAG: V-type ATP synthase subunit E family protein [Desulfatiglandales bacterium]